MQINKPVFAFVLRISLNSNLSNMVIIRLFEGPILIKKLCISRLPTILYRLSIVRGQVILLPSDLVCLGIVNFYSF